MTYDFLKGMRVIEGASFIAAPSCGLHLLQFGAEVIRFDLIGGGPDYRRWPLAPNGTSLYWEGLNAGKKSVAVDLTRPEGREVALRLATAPGDRGGLFVTNYPVDGFLAHSRLIALRADMITLRIMGWPDGRPAVDYTVNCAIGVPSITGPSGSEVPVNHVLPAWDLLTGAYAAFCLVAAESHRRTTSMGQEIRIPLGDVAIGSLGQLGQIAEVMVTGHDRPRMGNDLFGAFGRDFATKDGERVMIVAITARQWAGLVNALDLIVPIGQLEAELGISFAVDEGLRFLHRERLFPLVSQAVAVRELSALGKLFDEVGVCWGPYATLRQAAGSDPTLVQRNPIFKDVEHPSGLAYPTPGALATLTGQERPPSRRAPRLGEHTDEILAEVLGMSELEIGGLHDRGLVAGLADEG